MKIVILGDSIRQAYGPVVEEALRKEGHEVWQPVDNCRYAKHTFRMIFDYHEQIKDADIIHFNVGLWDVCKINDDINFTPLEQYIFDLERVAKALLKITPHVIFSTTTPVKPNHPHNNNVDIDEYNKAAIRVMNKLHVKVNDLGGLIKKDIERYIKEEDLIHLTEEGVKVASESVLKTIKEEIKK